LLTFVLSVVGFADHYDAAPKSRPLPDLLYLSLQLFVLESGDIEPPLDWKLNLARLLAPVLALVGTAGVVRALVSALRHRTSMAGIHDHAIICGYGRKGRRLAEQEIADRTTRVVVIDENPPAEDAFEEEPRITFLSGDATDPAVLMRARIEHARTLYAVTGSDGVNAAIAAQAQAMLPGSGREDPLELFVHIVDPELNTLLAPVLNKTAPAVSSSVNVYVLAARTIARDLPSDFGTKGAVIIIGVGYLGQSLVVELAKRAQLENRQFSVVLVDLEAEEKVEDLKARHPELSKWCQLRPHTADITKRDFEEGDYLLEDEPVDRVFVLMEDDELGLKTGLNVARTLAKTQRPPAPIVIRMSRTDSGLGLAIKQTIMPAIYGGVTIYDMHEKTCKPSVFRDDRSWGPV
jgi:Trk K+ transport system NAD-binding subunit